MLMLMLTIKFYRRHIAAPSHCDSLGGKGWVDTGAPLGCQIFDSQVRVLGTRWGGGVSADVVVWDRLFRWTFCLRGCCCEYCRISAMLCCSEAFCYSSRSLSLRVLTASFIDSVCYAYSDPSLWNRVRSSSRSTGHVSSLPYVSAQISDKRPHRSNPLRLGQDNINGWQPTRLRSFDQTRRAGSMEGALPGPHGDPIARKGQRSPLVHRRHLHRHPRPPARHILGLLSPPGLHNLRLRHRHNVR